MRVEPFRRWAPPLAWTAVILFLSGDAASAQHTGDILRELFRGLTDQQFGTLHFLVRKAAHVIEYAILGALNFRALRAGREGWALRWAAVAIALAAAVAAIDETHQFFVPSRGSSPADVLLDMAGASIGQAAWGGVTKRSSSARSS